MTEQGSMSHGVTLSATLYGIALCRNVYCITSREVSTPMSCALTTHVHVAIKYLDMRGSGFVKISSA